MADDPKPCHMCGKPLTVADLDQGRAIGILGRVYCVSCADRRVQGKGPRRFLPGKQTLLILLILLILLASALLGALAVVLLR